MRSSFYTAVQGAMTQQKNMGILSNNIANINTNGYKSKTASFLDLVYNNMRAPANENTTLQAGAGTIVNTTNTNFDTGTILKTGNKLDFAIDGKGFFRIYDPQTNTVSYTKDGAFILAETENGIFLTDDKGKFVTDNVGNPIRYENGELSANPGMFEFISTTGMLSIGDNNFVPVVQNGQEIVSTDSKLIQGCVEGSNVNLADEMAKVIESSRAYSYMLKMVQTSDEIEQTINSLR